MIEPLPEELSHRVFLGLGSNLGDREALMERAIRLIGERVGEVIARSSFLESAPWGFRSKRRFLNAVVCSKTKLTPHQVLDITQQIECELGRRRKSSVSKSGQPVYADRTMDIDILLYDELTVEEPDLKIPHPLMRERDFVMIPLKEVLRITYADREPSQSHDND